MQLAFHSNLMLDLEQESLTRGSRRFKVRNVGDGKGGV